ncbi:hypothetical protein A3I42_04810 [Candidatus Uhrbacteria bacterium RIFCSPLOWO2_02_FULL_49_11]|uniref:Uncharacterized protein n=1 Tax=Candidatus Uhrbacteria bacterium RIFCSPLOWO2_02_FULL_49_11 TaxID=1802409 RepID=A0A1F7VAR3_9BACT|nr:MAG: hypothetical protein A3I42_04810 [Candidatus Uhrbacteria bacterium RIFCSPLOWO2_02_FULL_49_11]
MNLYHPATPWEVIRLRRIDPVTTDPKGKIRLMSDHTPTLANVHRDYVHVMWTTIRGEMKI